MDDLKLFAKSNDQIDSLVQSLHISDEDIGMQFGIKKCGVIIMGTGKVTRADGIRLPDGQNTENTDNNSYTYLGILETNKIKEEEIKKTYIAKSMSGSYD